MSQTILLKRAYDPQSRSDGYRIYVDRLWPRGLSHETFHYDMWDKQIAPSTPLREWFHADPDARWSDFCQKYLDELHHSHAAAELKTQLADRSVVTLLYSSHDHEHNNAVVLKSFLSE